MLSPAEGGPDVKRAHLAVPDDEQPRFLETRVETLQERNVQAVIGLVTRDHVGGQRQPQGIERGDHEFDLGSARIIFAVTELHQPALDHLMANRYRGGIALNHLGRQLIDGYAALI